MDNATGTDTWKDLKELLTRARLQELPAQALCELCHLLAVGINERWSKPWLGNATTLNLINELKARHDDTESLNLLSQFKSRLSAQQIHYKTVESPQGHLSNDSKSILVDANSDLRLRFHTGEEIHIRNGLVSMSESASALGWTMAVKKWCGNIRKLYALEQMETNNDIAGNILAKLREAYSRSSYPERVGYGDCIAMIEPLTKNDRI